MSDALSAECTLQLRSAWAQDWDEFLAWCTAEGWIISRLERSLLQNRWRSCFWVLWEGSSRRAFISVVKYPRSAWIGNLIVDPLQRGKGYGSVLFKAGLNRLDATGINRVWLTASPMGEPIYTKQGFFKVGTCQRWLGTGSGRGVNHSAAFETRQRIIGWDTSAWGEPRHELLEYLSCVSTPVTNKHFAAMVQPGASSSHIGPWISTQNSGAEPAYIEDFIGRLRSACPAGYTLSADILESSALGPYLEREGFKTCSSTALMCRTGEEVNIDRVHALASLGSMG